MYCENCGKRIAETAKFCPYCGNAVRIANSLQTQQGIKLEKTTPVSLETRQESIPDSPETRQEPKYVGFWARFAAYFLDYTLILIFSAVPSLILYCVSHNDLAMLVLINVLSLLAHIMFLVLWFKKQASIGQMAISAKIVDARTGGVPTKGQLIGRYFACFLSSLPLGLGFLWIAFDSKKQGWHDKLAGTAVIYV